MDSILGRCHQETGSTDGAGYLVVTGTDDELLAVLQDDKASSIPATHARVSIFAIGVSPIVHLRRDG
jgi:hypothetical protein